MAGSIGHCRGVRVYGYECLRHSVHTRIGKPMDSKRLVAMKLWDGSV
jgi:hypothetical protein